MYVVDADTENKLVHIKYYNRETRCWVSGCIPIDAVDSFVRDTLREIDCNEILYECDEINIVQH